MKKIIGFVIFILIFSLVGCAVKEDENIQYQSSNKEVTEEVDFSNYTWTENNSTTIIYGQNKEESKEETSNYVDMSSYESFDSSLTYRFIDSSVKEMKEAIDNEKTGVFFYSFSKCPHCNNIINLLAEVSNEHNTDIYYIDTRKNPEWESNTDINDYDLLVEMVGHTLSEDEEGIPHLYVPVIYFIKDGKLVYGSNPVYEEITEEIKQEIINDFNEGFKLIQ